MNETAVGLDQTEEEILAFEISDEALENIASTAKENAANQTVAFCSGWLNCPA